MLSVGGVVFVYEGIQRLLTILTAIVDPFELPGKVKAEQELKFAESLAKGEPNRSKNALTVASDKVRELA